MTCMRAAIRKRQCVVVLGALLAWFCTIASQAQDFGDTWPIKPVLSAEPLYLAGTIGHASIGYVAEMPQQPLDVESVRRDFRV